MTHNLTTRRLLPLVLTAALFAPLYAKTPLHRPKTAHAEPAAAAPAPTTSAPLDLEVGLVGGFNPNVELSRSGTPYQSGADAFGIPVWTFGVRAKKDFDNLGVRAAVQYSFSPERIHTDSTTATPTQAIKDSGNSITIPISFCINPVKSDKAAIYVGAGMGYSSYTTDRIYTTGSENTKTSGIDWNFLFGAELFITGKFAISLEYVMIRGYDNQASFSRSASNLTSVAVNRNVDQFLIGANLRL